MMTDDELMQACAESDHWHDLLTAADAHDRETGAYEEFEE